ncbi:hypothetical protein [Corticicoccus populi]|uniref:Uncharacterized protein n=1 Tax=Corticicoccus populi TaxID=1812821 RepID=A0ABW5WS59_9STAP
MNEKPYMLLALGFVVMTAGLFEVWPEWIGVPLGFWIYCVGLYMRCAPHDFQSLKNLL